MCKRLGWSWRWTHKKKKEGEKQKRAFIVTVVGNKWREKVFGPWKRKWLEEGAIGERVKDPTYQNKEEWGQLAMLVAVEVPHRMRQFLVLDILMCGPCPRAADYDYDYCNQFLYFCASVKWTKGMHLINSNQDKLFFIMKLCINLIEVNPS